MHLWSNEELEMLRGTARRFFTEYVTPHEKRWDAQQHVDRQLWNQAGALGLLCASIPVEYGGTGGSFRHEAVLYEEQAYANNASFGIQAYSGICAHSFANYGTEYQKQRQ